MRATLWILIGLIPFGCSEQKSEQPPKVQPATIAEPATAPPLPSIGDDEVAVSKAELRGVCLLHHFRFAGNTSSIEVMSLMLDNASPGEAFPWVIIDTEGTALGGRYSPEEYLEHVIQWGFYEPSDMSVCNSVSRYPRPAIVTALVRDYSKNRKRGYWLHVGATRALMDDSEAKPVFIGNVEHEEARAKSIEMLQEFTQAKFGSRVKFGGESGLADWIEAVNAKP